MNGSWVLVVAVGGTRLALAVASWWFTIVAERARTRAVGELLAIAGPGATIRQHSAAGSLVVSCDLEDA